jgi:RHS repeat-associated protein
LRFAGQYYDSETGLHYNYHRYYDPKIGRYLRADPIGLFGGVNLYSYVNNRPIISSDPFGLKSILDDFGGSLGGEGHFIGGGGADVNMCCDDSNNRWLVVTTKACLGAGFGWSIGGNVQGSKSKKNCPNGYAGFTLEIGGGPFEGGISITDNPILAFGLTYGIYGKLTVCHTWIIHKEKIGCCERGMWHQK